MDVLMRIDEYLGEAGMPPTTFGRLAARDPGLVRDLRRGRRPRPPMMARLHGFLNRHHAGHQA